MCRSSRAMASPAANSAALPRRPRGPLTSMNCIKKSLAYLTRSSSRLGGRASTGSGLDACVGEGGPRNSPGWSGVHIARMREAPPPPPRRYAAAPKTLRRYAARSLSIPAYQLGLQHLAAALAEHGERVAAGHARRPQHDRPQADLVVHGCRRHAQKFCDEEAAPAARSGERMSIVVARRQQAPRCCA
eukprot:353171-Chlamydomonas_euryale.AAC.13